MSTKRQSFALVANPVAGRRRRKRLDAVVARLTAAGARVDIFWTKGPGDGTSQARKAVDKQPDAIVAAGGDGTINEVLNGMADSGIPLGILPFGTANVLAVEIGLSCRPKQLVDTLLEGELLAIRPGTVRPLGEAGDSALCSAQATRPGSQLFCLMGGVGLDAETIDQVCLRTKRFFGKGAYVRAIVDRLRKRPLSDIRLSVDGQEAAGCFAVISKSSCYGGRFIVTPEAGLAADHFAVCVFAPRNRFRLVRQLAGVRFGSHLKMDDVHFLKGRRVVAVCEGGSLYQTDGDLRGRLPVEFRLAEHRVPLIVPVVGRSR